MLNYASALPSSPSPLPPLVVVVVLSRPVLVVFPALAGPRPLISSSNPAALSRPPRPNHRPHRPRRPRLLIVAALVVPVVAALVVPVICPLACDETTNENGERLVFFQ